MNKSLIVLLSVLFSCIALSSSSQIILKVKNIQSVEGQIICGLYDNPDVFLEEGKERVVKKTKVKGNEMLITFDSLEASTYAFSIFHDINSNGEIEKNFFGIPKEPYGFSQNYKPVFRAPRHSECAFVYDGKKVEIEIILLD